jgi:proteasome lid subunit RPN8/RPN11
MTEECYATDGLVEYLLDYAREREPQSVTVSLGVTPAEALDLPEVSPETPVFTHFYMPQAGSSVNAVFGMDLGTPIGQTKGRFVSHPEGGLDVSETDDLHAVVFVAVPPWDRDSIAAFDRSGRRLQLDVLDVEPPEEAL